MNLLLILLKIFTVCNKNGNFIGFSKLTGSELNIQNGGLHWLIAWQNLVLGSLQLSYFTTNSDLVWGLIRAGLIRARISYSLAVNVPVPFENLIQGFWGFHPCIYIAYLVFVKTLSKLPCLTHISLAAFCWALANNADPDQMPHSVVSHQSSLFAYSMVFQNWIKMGLYMRKPVFCVCELKRVGKSNRLKWVKFHTHVINMSLVEQSTHNSELLILRMYIWAVTCDFQQCGILTSVDSDEPVQPSFKLRNSKMLFSQ